MTKEERELRREQREHMKRMEAAAKEAGRGPIDVPFLLLVLLLTGVGLIMLLSASFPSAYYESGDPLRYFKRQAVFAVLGLAAMVVIGRINYARFRGVAKIALGISIALLVAVIIPGVGITSHGATRWLGIPGTTMQFQPSEIAKLGVILYFADSISKKKDKMRTLRYGILPYGFILVLIAVLMYFEPHLSGTVLILGIGAAMMFVGGIQGYWVGIGIGGRARHQFDQRHIQFLAQLDDGTRCRKLIDTHVVATNADTRVGGDTRNIHLGPFRLAQFRHRNVIL